MAADTSRVLIVGRIGLASLNSKLKSSPDILSRRASVRIGNDVVLSSGILRQDGSN